MSGDPITVGEEDSLREALQSMRRCGVRRMPVVGERGELVGILSLDDIVDVLAGELADVAGSIRSGQLVESSVRP
jgi:CBS domain-containing protein